MCFFSGPQNPERRGSLSTGRLAGGASGNQNGQFLSMLRVESGQGAGALLPDLLWEAQGMAGSMVPSKHTGFHPFPTVGAPTKGAGIPPSRMDVFSLHRLTPDSGLEGSIPGSSVTLTNVHISAQVLQSLFPEHSVQPRPDPGSP